MLPSVSDEAEMRVKLLSCLETFSISLKFPFIHFLLTASREYLITGYDARMVLLRVIFHRYEKSHEQVNFLRKNTVSSTFWTPSKQG